MTQRLTDWQSRLAACLAERCALPFAWGSLDCALLSADSVLACTGVDPAAKYRGTYKSEAGAARLLKRLGGLEGIASSSFGPEIPPLMAQAGDIGLVDNGGQPCLAVCGGTAWLAPGPDGLVSVPVEQASRAWRVCRGEE